MPMTPRPPSWNSTFTPQVDTVFGRYRVFESLGTGGVGEVFRAHDTELGRSVALKVLHRRHDATGTGLTRAGAARLLREARTAATLQHPNAVVVFDADEHEGVPYLVMELVDGTTLRALVGDATISVERKIGWLLDVARALAAAHAKGIVHQDVKPENVMLRHDDVIKVLDFGVARRVVDPDAGPAGAADGIYGTPAYVAPERVNGEVGDALADQFSWGVLAYELLVGEHPWGVDTPLTHVTARVLSRPTPVPPSDRCDDVPKAIGKIVLRTLATRPKDRFASMKDVIAAIIASWSKPAPQPLRALARFARRRGRELAVVVSAAIALDVVASKPNPPAIHVAAALPAAEASAPNFGSAMSSNGEAVAAYRAGVAAMWGAGRAAAQRELARAVALDPAFAAAYLRLALVTPSASDADRASLLKAMQLRVALSAHDRALLRAFEPWVNVPQDSAEVERRLAALVVEHREPDYLYQLCRVRILMRSYAGSLDACRAAHEIDPSFASAYGLEGQAHLGLGDTPAANKALDQCLRMSKVATSCLIDVLQVQSRAGACSAALDYAHRLVDLEPSNYAGLRELANAMYANGADPSAVRDVFDRAAAVRPPNPAKFERAAFRMNVAVLSGDFDEARAQLDTCDAVAETSNEETDHAEALVARAWLYREIGQEAALVARARSFLARRAALSPAFDVDRSIGASVILYRGSAMPRADFVSARDAWWTREERRAAVAPGVLWTMAYAAPAVTTEDAETAIARLPRPPPDRMRDESFDEPAGAVALMAHRRGEALPLLRRAARSCRAAVNPFQYVWAHAELGEALESTDVTGACAAYAVVLAHWGTAADALSARRARERRAALRCP